MPTSTQLILGSIPFVVLLAAIAVLPLAGKRWWERNYPVVSLGLGGIAAVYCLFALREPNAVYGSISDYVSFMALVGSLYVIAGGIHIRLRGKSKPSTNLAFLMIGAVTANLVGTTGASMILIRPFIRVNRYRIKAYHIIFFIFIVSNVGGAVTPVGDPPLFVGYLKGIPFFWSVKNLWHIWLLAVGVILTIFYFIDLRNFRARSNRISDTAGGFHETGEVTGLHNLLFLGVVLAAVFVTRPPFLREALMIAAAAGSYFTTPREVHEKNAFDFGPVKEVAILFAGIFTTMVPALEWIAQNAAHLGFRDAGQFYWSTGTLSSVLDNTPTYLNFLSAALGAFVSNGAVHQILQIVQAHGPSPLLSGGGYSPDIRNALGTLAASSPALVASGGLTADQAATAYLLANHGVVVQAISTGAVFFGAMTYIGNGPNFMVKSIAEQSGVECPSFITYFARYAVPILIPIFILIWFLFFR